MRTSTKKNRQATTNEDDDFCLADTLALMNDEELERMAEEDAQSDVSSSAYEGIPLDKATLKAGLIESYRKLRAEWPTQRRERMNQVQRIGGGQ